MFGTTTFYVLFYLLLTIALAAGVNNYWNHVNQDPNDDRPDAVDSATRATTFKPMPMKRNNVPLGSVSCADSRRCGCYKGNCWAYIDENQTSGTGWWCFTQREGIRGMQKAWAKCTNSTQCSWTMTCGDCWTWVGRKTGIKTNKILC